jgi:DNA polymerase-3 subunit epsilon
MDVALPILTTEILVFDFESTGSVCGYANEPWQIGMVSLKQGRLDTDSMFESLLRVDANRPFNPHAPGRHGRLRDAIAVAPTPQQLWPKIMPRLTGGPLCAHNVATEKKLTRAMAPMHRFGPWIDTLRVARKAWPDCPSYALGDLIEQLHLKSRVDTICPGREAHDALYDAVASALLLEAVLAQPGWADLTVGELVAVK